MLRAFSYYEPEEENRVRKGIKDNRFFEQELKIAKDYSDSHPFKGMMIKICPICSSKEVSVFFEKWGITYSRCKECYSIFANVDEEDVRGYLDLDDRNAIRHSEEYQKEATESRSQIWEDTVDWIGFRTFRYLGKKEELSILDYGNRWKGLRNMIREAPFCKKYETNEDIKMLSDNNSKYDVVLAMDYLQQKTEPYTMLKGIKANLKDNGIFIMGTKAGSGLDVLLLKGNNRNVFPYEHLLMPSKQGILLMLEKVGFEVLEFTTPGSFDVNYVKNNIAGLSEDEVFFRYLFETSSEQTGAELQRFIQKNGLSSYAQVVARKKQ